MSAARREIGNTAIICKDDRVLIMGVRVKRRSSILEQERREFVEAAAPGLPFVCGVRRNVNGILNSHRVERLVVCQDALRSLFTAAADEQDFDFFLKAGRVDDVVGGNDAATE